MTFSEEIAGLRDELEALKVEHKRKRNLLIRDVVLWVVVSGGIAVLLFCVVP